jgi:chromosome segregation ATPase
MSHLPDDEGSQLGYVSKSTFLHLWDKFKQTEQALAEAERIKDNFARSVIDLGNQARESADQLKALREELAEADRISEEYGKAALDLSNECQEASEQVVALKKELARVQEDLHTANDMLAKVFKPRQ